MDHSSRGTQLSLSNVSRSFGARSAISNIDFTVHAGEFVSLLGPSGSGKSTLLRIIAGLESSDSGEVKASSKQRSFVFQEAALLPWRTVLDNVALPLELSGVGIPDRERSAREVLLQVGLQESADLFPNQLSGGMKMRASVARALVSRPSLLLLDEPFAALDERTRHRLQEDLRSLWLQLGMTVVFVTHSASEAVFVSDRAIVLSSGPGARLIDDHEIDLGRDRKSTLRNEPRFHSEIARLNKSFERESSGNLA